MRTSGVLLPVFSLPSGSGIGCISKEAYSFIDWMHEAHQKYWQILPMGPAGSWNSPYQPLSCFAGDPVFIDPETLFHKKLLTAQELRRCHSIFYTEKATRVNYELVHMDRHNILRKAFSRFQPDEGYDSFCAQNAEWLDDYALFIALHDHFEDQSWTEWPEVLRTREADAIARYRNELHTEIDFHRWAQYEFFTEWSALKEYAHSKGIQIIGDIPFYVSYDSADCWMHPELFKLGRRLRPTAVAGCPPDDFSPDGQLWGNPLYNWSAMKRDGYRWWIQRLRQNFRLYDVIRIDHFRGLESYFSIPANAESASAGKWVCGPRMAFFRAVYKAFGRDCPLIAEDLGHITPAVRKLIRQSGLPGMKVLQFAFDGNPENPYLPENFTTDCVVYTGTHDNDTTFGWYNSLSRDAKRSVTEYIRDHHGIPSRGRHGTAPVFGAASVTRHLVELAFYSKADTCIIPVQDYLLLDSEARINTPGTIGNNWNWRMTKAALSEELAAYVARLTHLSERG